MCALLSLSLSQQVKSGVIITMERCDGDLHKLLESKQCFAEKEVVDFLHQLGKWSHQLGKWSISWTKRPPGFLLWYLLKERTEEK